MSCVDVVVQLRLYYSGDKPKYEAEVTSIAGWKPVELPGNCRYRGWWFIGNSSNEAIGKMVSSDWADDFLFRHGKQACRFVFKGDVNG